MASRAQQQQEQEAGRKTLSVKCAWACTLKPRMCIHACWRPHNRNMHAATALLLPLLCVCTCSRYMPTTASP